MNNLFEISDVYRTNISRRRINKKNKKQKKSLELQAEFICRESLRDTFIHNVFQKFSDGYVYYNSDESNILGLCLWKYYKEINNLHILLLCSKDPTYNLGKTILHDVEYYCFENKIKSITVAPADIDLFSYYSKLGFKITDTDFIKLVPFKKRAHLLSDWFKRFVREKLEAW